MQNKTSLNFLKNFFIISSGTLLNIIISIFTTPIITRIVSPLQYGQWSIFILYSNMVVTVLCLGLDQALIRFFYDYNEIEYHRSLFRFCFGSSFVISAIFGGLFTILIVTHVIPFEFDKFISILLSINILASLFNRFSLLLLRILYKTKLYTLCTILIKVIFVISALMLLHYYPKFHFEWLCVSTLLSNFLPGMIACILTKKMWCFYPKWNILNRREILGYGLPFVLSMGLTTLFQAIDKISLNYYCTYTEVGVYASAITIVNVFAIIQSAFNTLWAPIQSERLTKELTNKNFFREINQYVTVIMLFFGILLIVSKDFLIFLLGPEFRKAAYIVPFLIFNPIMYTISETTTSGIEYTKKSYLYIFVGIISCLTNFAGNLILVPVFQSVGAAISTGLSYIVFWALRTYYSNKYFYVDYRIKQLIICLLFMILLALYSSFKKLDFITIILSCANILIISALYKNYIGNMYKYIKRYCVQYISAIRKK